MKFFLVFFFLFGFLIQNSFGTLGHETDTQVKGDPSKCHSKTYKIDIVKGRDYQLPKGCGSMYCNDKYEIVYSTCGIKDVKSSKCKVEKNPSAPYPQCCGKVVCP